MEFNSLSYKRTTRNITIVCGILFFIFSFVYLFVYQNELVGVLYTSLINGHSEYSDVECIIFIIFILFLLRWGVNSLLGLKGALRSLAYFPSFLLLGVITDIDNTIYHGVRINGIWSWLLPLLIIMYIIIGLFVRRIGRIWLNKKLNDVKLFNYNISYMVMMSIMTISIGNSNVDFHHELQIENAIKEGDYIRALKIGSKSPNVNKNFTSLRNYAMLKSHKIGECLFEFPQNYTSEALLFDEANKNNLSIKNDSIYKYLGFKAFKNEKSLNYLSRIHKFDINNKNINDYYLAALLLDKDLKGFKLLFDSSYNDTILVPKYFQEALILYYDEKKDKLPMYINESIIKRYKEYLKDEKEYKSLIERNNKIHQEYGNTYWWYYTYK